MFDFSSWYDPFSLQDYINFLIFMSVVTISSTVLIRIFTPPEND